MYESVQDTGSAPETEISSYDCYLAFEQKKGTQGELLCENKPLSFSFLQPGDTLVVESNERTIGNGYMCSITDSQWEHLGISDGPLCKTVKAHLAGSCIPVDIENKEVCLLGSGDGGLSVHLGEIVPGAMIYVGSDNRELHLPRTYDYAIARKESGDVKIVDPEDVVFHTEGVSELHKSRLLRVQGLFQELGLGEQYVNFLDCSKKTDSFSEEKENTIIVYQAGMAMGNQLMVFNKVTRCLYAFKYFNYSKEDVLQIAYVELTNSHEVQPEQNKVSAMSISGMYRSCNSIVTHTTSPAHGLDSITYHTSTEENQDLLGISQYFPGSYAGPEIRLSEKNGLEIIETYPYSQVVQGDKEMGIRVRTMISGNWRGDERHVLHIRDKVINTKSTKEIFDGIHN